MKPDTVKLDTERIGKMIIQADDYHDYALSTPHDGQHSGEIIAWSLHSIATSLMAIARILADKEGHGDE